MAFNNIGPLTTLVAGQSITWSYTFVGDPGTQFASADLQTPYPYNSDPGVPHLADGQMKSLDGNGNATYYVTITNQGPGVCYHNLQGGGMS